nr:helicase-related protein [Petrachloros mirabilis]
MSNPIAIPAVSVTYAQDGTSTSANALKDPAQKNNRDRVDIIIALAMAKEGFDWIWCEHALTIGYRASLTEIIQIIGRATRDAPGKTRFPLLPLGEGLGV